MGLRYLVSPALHEWRAGLAQARHDAGLSQGDLHKLSGLPQAVVSRLENGNRISGVSFSESVYESSSGSERPSGVRLQCWLK